MSAIQPIGYACGLGAVKEECGRGPEALLQSGLEAFLQECGVNLLHADVIHPVEGSDKFSILNKIISQLARVVYETRKQGHLPLILGGDHSSAIGTWAGVCESINGQGHMGMIWVDAHMDSHTPDTSPSGALHGMPLACLLGHGHADLLQIGGRAQKFLPRNTCILGVRSYESEEYALLQKLGVRIYFMHEIVERGMQSVMQEALNRACDNTVGIGLSIDLDAVDPALAPAVGTPEEAGLKEEDLGILMQAMRQQRKNLTAVELVEFNPRYDQDNQTQGLIFSLLKQLLMP